VSDNLLAHVQFQRMWANYALSTKQQSDADAAKIQEKWLADLEDFVKQHPASPDSAEALLQLGMYQEFAGKTDEASGWYQKLAAFADSPQANKAKGAVVRLSSVGKPIRLRGTDLQGGTLDLASYRGKLVLIHYWATWCDVCKDDMAHIKELYAKNAGRGFDVIGVSLDKSPAPVKQFLRENRYPWKQIYEPGGLDGELANQMGVMTLPLMILVDQKGNVVSNNIHAAELDDELARLLK